MKIYDIMIIRKCPDCGKTFPVIKYFLDTNAPNIITIDGNYIELIKCFDCTISQSHEGIHKGRSASARGA